MNRDLRKTGLSFMKEVPWGTHFCQFYSTKQDLLDILVSYFKAGLEDNEFCMWVTSGSLPVEEAKEALRKAVPGLASFFKKGQIEIIPHTRWYLKEGGFSQKRVLDGWVKKLEVARKKGFGGLRLTGDTFWLEKKDWKKFTDYEEAVNRVIRNYKMLAVCTYALEKCGAADIVDVINNHQFAIVKKAGHWIRLESSAHKRAEEALRGNEERLQRLLQEHEMIFDSVPAWLFYKDKENRFIRVNKFFAKMMGLPKKDLEGKFMQEIFPREQAEAFWKDDKEVIASGKPKLGIVEPVDTQEGRRWVRTDKVPYRDEQGHIVGIIGFAVDITERQETQEVLRRNEERLNKAQAISHVGSWELDLVNDRLTWSDEVYRIFGLKPQEFPATYGAFLKAVHPDDRRAVDKAYSRSLREGREGYEIEHRIIKRSTGEIRAVYEKCEHIRDARGRIIRSIGMVHDITERKAAEIKIKHLSTFPQLNPNPVLELDKKGKVIFANLAAIKTLERLKAPKQLKLFLPPDFPRMLESLAAGKSEIFRREIKIRDTVFAESIHLVPALNVARLYARDATASAAAQEALEKAHKELELVVNERTDELKRTNVKLAEEIEERKKTEQALSHARRLSDIGTLAATVAHELRNPLAAMRMAAYNIRHKAQNPLLDKHLQNIEIKINDSEQIINNLLFYARLKTPVFLPVDICAILEECIVGARAHFPQRAVKIAKRFKTFQGFVIEADPLQIKELLTNILNNAFEAVAETTGVVTVFGILRELNFIEIKIKDNGSGIRREDLPRVFEPFFSTKAKGTGLGLAVCFQIAQLHSGSISIKSREGQGTSVSVILPLRKRR